jgi:hypothetical protein
MSVSPDPEMERLARRKETVQKYLGANRDRINAQRRARRAADPANPREAVRRYLADPEARRKHNERARQWRLANPARVREANRRLGATRETRTVNHGNSWRGAYAKFWNAQGGRCYLCGTELSEDKMPNGRGRLTVIDHDHSCCPKHRSCEICRRGLACNRCNKLIGAAEDNPELLRRIADNLEVANALVRRRMAMQAAQLALF